MRNLQPDPVVGGWKLVTSDGKTMEQLLIKCRMLLYYVDGEDALLLQDRWVVLVRLMQVCCQYLPDTYILRLMWGV